MKRENLFLVAGALLASTSLTTSAFAGTHALRSSGVALTGPQTVLSQSGVLAISAQAFSPTAATANTVVSGSVDLFLRFNQQLTTTFSANISITGAQFSGSGGTAQGIYYESASGTLASVVALSNICNSAVAGSDVILLSTCDGRHSASVSGALLTATGLVVQGVRFTSMSPLATAGSSVAISSVITVNSVSFETTASANEITSRDSITTSGTAGSALTADVAPANRGAFTAVTTSVLSAVIATVQVSLNSALGTDLSTVISGASAVGGSEVRVTSAIATDDAVNQFRLTSAASTVALTTSVFSGGFVTFSIAAASLGSTDSFAVRVDFNGTKEIDAVTSAGTAVASYTAVTSGAGNLNNITAPPAGTVAVSTIQRNGLNIDLNGVYGGGFPIQYTSIIRVANSGTIAAAPVFTIVDEATGSQIGTTVTGIMSPTTGLFVANGTIPGGASTQFTAANLEAAAGLTASTRTYRITVTGGLTGYVQQLLWNQTGGFFTDLSGRRTSRTGNN